MTGATPVFCDIDILTYHMSLDSIKRMYSDKVKAIIYIIYLVICQILAKSKNFVKKKISIYRRRQQSLGSKFIII